jgi:uncharacterized membrane protein
MMFFGWLLAVLGFGALAYRLGWHEWQVKNDPRSPLDILNERYARGEIDYNEYHTMREDLEA